MKFPCITPHTTITIKCNQCAFTVPHDFVGHAIMIEHMREKHPQAAKIGGAE